MLARGCEFADLDLCRPARGWTQGEEVGQGIRTEAFGGFHTFGEIAAVSSCGEDIVVEFYDMRAAHQAMCFPGNNSFQLSCSFKKNLF